MDWLDHTLPTLAENLALDEALVLDAEAGHGGGGLRVWGGATDAVVVRGRGQGAADGDVVPCSAPRVAARRPPPPRGASGWGPPGARARPPPPCRWPKSADSSPTSTVKPSGFTDADHERTCHATYLLDRPPAVGVGDAGAGGGLAAADRPA